MQTGALVSRALAVLAGGAAVVGSAVTFDGRGSVVDAQVATPATVVSSQLRSVRYELSKVDPAYIESVSFRAPQPPPADTTITANLGGPHSYPCSATGALVACDTTVGGAPAVSDVTELRVTMLSATKPAR